MNQEKFNAAVALLNESGVKYMLGVSVDVGDENTKSAAIVNTSEEDAVIIILTFLHDKRLRDIFYKVIDGKRSGYFSVEMSQLH